MRGSGWRGCALRWGSGLLGACLFLAAAAVPRSSTEQSLRLGGLDVTVWAPAASDAPLPLLIFSHGYHGCATQSRFLMERFAAAGYLVFAPNHRDAACGGGHASLAARPTPGFAHPEDWSEDSFRDRAEDIRRLLAAIGEDPQFRGRVDGSRLGLVGHSLGGYTVLGLAGAWPGWKLDGVRAVLALSPYSQPYIAHHSLGGLGAPVMYQGGTLDYAITPALARAGGAYDLSPAPKLFVEFSGAGHFAWTNLRDARHTLIADYALAFMDRYLNHQPQPQLRQARPGVVDLRYTGDDPAAGASR